MRLYFFRRTFRECCLSSQRGELKSVTMNDTTTKNQRRSGKREREREEGRGRREKGRTVTCAKKVGRNESNRQRGKGFARMASVGGFNEVSCNYMH